jgi:predicted aspartyl protease
MMQAPYPSLRIRYVAQGIAGNAVALLDTGFDGYLAVPEGLIGALPRPARRRVQTASGQVVRVPVYLGTVELVDQPGPIDALIIALGDEYLLGLATLNHFSVTFDHGRQVSVEL